MKKINYKSSVVDINFGEKASQNAFHALQKILNETSILQNNIFGLKANFKNFKLLKIKKQKGEKVVFVRI